MEVDVPIIIPNSGYTRPSVMTPGDPTPLDSGNINSLTVGLSCDPSVLQPLAANTSIFNLTNTLTNGYNASLLPSSVDTTLFMLNGASLLTGDSGVIAYVKYKAVYAPVVSIPLYDTVSTPQPYVLWRFIPELFTLDSVCGLGASLDVVYSDVASLGQSSPNPVVAVNSPALIPFTIAHTTNVYLAVYNALGREVAQLVNTTLAQGAYTAEFTPQEMPSGLYYYRLVTGDGVLTKTMVILR